MGSPCARLSPALMVDKLPQELDGRLGAVHLESAQGCVEISRQSHTGFNSHAVVHRLIQQHPLACCALLAQPRRGYPSSLRGAGSAPTSSAGMLRSSTNTTACVPQGGPYTPLRLLSIFPSMMSWVCKVEGFEDRATAILVIFMWLAHLSHAASTVASRVRTRQGPLPKPAPTQLAAPSSSQPA